MSQTITEGLFRTDLSPFAVFKTAMENGEEAYAAGFPWYPANFSRDTLLSGIIASSSDLLSSQLEISAQYQGTHDDPVTGEKEGRIHHEQPGAALEGREGLTTYNACDTTALFLIGAEGLSYIEEDKYQNFDAKRHENMQKAVREILSSVDPQDNLFWESPPQNIGKFSLRVTYWKDSILPHADGKSEPVYPVSFALSHFMAARGLLSASRLLGQNELAEQADRMFKAGIQSFMSPTSFTVYKDSEGELRQASSDEMHSLAYIPVGYEALLPIAEIKKRAQTLETPYGYVCTPPEISQHLSDKYHGDKLWVFEQAMIHYGASKFGLLHEATVAEAISDHIGEGQELFSLTKDSELIPEGNNLQLWSCAARDYFAGNSLLSRQPWL